MNPLTSTAIFAAANICAIAPLHASPAEEYISLMDKTIEKMNDAGDILLSITDKASADAAATKLKEVKDDLNPIVKDLQEVVNDELAEETLQEIMQAYKNSLAKYQEAQVKIFTAIQKLQEAEPPYFGSDDLKSVFEAAE